MTVKRHLFTVPDLMLMAEAGMFHDRHVELIDGEIYELTQNPPHIGTVNRLTRLFVLAFAGRAEVSIQNAISLEDDLWLPEPDLVVLRPDPHGYTTRHAVPADVLLLVEVSHSTLRHDQGRKLPKYAEVGIPETWIVDLAARSTLRYRSPQGGTYREVDEIPFGTTFAPAAFPDAERIWLEPLP